MEGFLRILEEQQRCGDDSVSIERRILEWNQKISGGLAGLDEGERGLFSVRLTSGLR